MWPRKDLAWDAGINQSPPSPTEFSLGHNLNSRGEVDEQMAQAERAGATILKAPHETFCGGYAGYFQDPDGHLWEVLWNPHLVISE